jgi:hypothetical protein
MEYPTQKNQMWIDDGNIVRMIDLNTKITWSKDEETKAFATSKGVEA